MRRAGPPAVTERGWGNVVLGAKWRFHDKEASKLSFALKPEIQLPVSKDREARGLGTARTSYGVSLLMTQETGFGAVHANAAVERVNYSDRAGRHLFAHEGSRPRSRHHPQHHGW